MLEIRDRIKTHLNQLYEKGQVDLLVPKIWRQIEDFIHEHPLFLTSDPTEAQLTQRDAILIVYADQFHAPDKSPLESLATFLQSNIGQAVNRLHILPFFPYSSDDGFSITDFRQVAPDLGTWTDISRLKENYRLMFDLVINHVSAQSVWFQKFLAGKPPYTGYFHIIEPGTDLQGIVRPRSTPLLTTFQTSSGHKQVWTTFSADQVDLNYANPQVLLEMVAVLLDYIAHGARIIRLDAIAYVWKEPGTTCIHLPEAHAMVKLLRAILDACAPSVLLITETNVPHLENIRYFGDPLPDFRRTDEAQMVYQFPLAPLILHAFVSGDASRLIDWVDGLRSLPLGCTFFNFTASHDGIGVRPAEGLLAPAQILALVERANAHGGQVSYGSDPRGRRIPYELNISWYDALNNPAKPDLEMDIRRFLASQAIMLCLAGVPGIYIHSLLGSRNCQSCLQATGRARSINREKFQLSELQQQLADGHGLRSRVLAGYLDLLNIRYDQPAFHPAVPQRILRLDPAVFALVRTTSGGSDLLCLTNVSDRRSETKIGMSDWDLPLHTTWVDLLTGDVFPGSKEMTVGLEPYQVRWLVTVPEPANPPLNPLTDSE